MRIRSRKLTWRQEEKKCTLRSKKEAFRMNFLLKIDTCQGQTPENIPGIMHNVPGIMSPEFLDKTSYWQTLETNPNHWRAQLRSMLKEYKQIVEKKL